MVDLKTVVEEERWEDNKGARFMQREVRLSSYVKGIFQLVSDHSDGKDVVGFRKKDIPSIIEALQQVLEDGK